MVEMFDGKPRTLYVSWGRNACKTFEQKNDMEEKNCKHCVHYEACCKWTDFPKQCGIPVCTRFSDVAPKSEVEKLKEDIEVWKQERFNIFQRLELYEMTRQKVAREIFEEIEKISKAPYGYICLSNDELAELKKKYTEV